ncbi:hypothetical protein PY093_17920 [Cytobacillus sp. S13-E01]|uniref:hypothetical protein n=1 Tax=Cytobacillus sp. S13-E01 TaxID=3031326 RepID=UPI0023D83798|nr:hypothetical protein [Cytobacillus sp. S13-E01]MDF0728516.1 hypothetical protein [Cytobacillus sp. S13-E01]
MQIFFLLIIPVLLAIFLFRFLQVKPLADLIHSMPINRECVFNHYLCLGVFFLLIPVLITGLVLIAGRITMDLDQLFPIKSVFYWAAV